VLIEIMRPGFRPVWAEVDLDAVRHNVRVLADVAAPAQLLAVVKADAYGHGAVPVARAALEAGATWLGVALVEEGVELRDAGIEARILLLSEPPTAAAATVVARGITPIVYTANGIEALAKAVADAGAQPFAVHIKVDTGMHRVGCSPDDALALVEAVDARTELVLEGICTHLAVADEPENSYNTEQLDRFDALLAALPERAVPLIVHAANSAGVLAHPRAHHHLVRCGIAIYGIPPATALGGRVALRPALALKARVSHTKLLPAGASVSYGRHYTMPTDANAVTVPVGYADGVPRSLGLMGGEVLIGGARRPIAGAVTMDQLVVDVGGDPFEADTESLLGMEVVLIGRQGDEEITAGEWAERLGVIPYEVTTRIGPRVPRVYLA
jgi:alanine racemase